MPFVGSSSSNTFTSLWMARAMEKYFGMGGLSRERMREGAQEIFGPELLPLWAQDEVDHLLAIGTMRRPLHQRHHIGHLDRSLLGNHKLDRSLVGVFGTIRIKVVVKHNRDHA